MLSNTCKYAIRAVIYLSINASEKRKIGIKAVSEDLQIPSPFLGKILQLLSKKKILMSTKGPNGGFCLSKIADDISVLDIVKIIDGLDFFENCIVGIKICSGSIKNKNKCPFHDKLDPIRDELFKQFKTLTIGSFKDGFDPKKNLLDL